MSKKLLIILSLLFFRLSFSQSTWIPQNTTGTIGTTFYDIQFVNPNTGFLIGDTTFKTTNAGISWTNMNIITHAAYFMNPDTGFVGYVTFSPSTKGIAKTTNGGANWVFTPSFNNDPVNSIHFINAQTGWAATGVQFGGEIEKTTNGGLNWSVCYSNDAQVRVQFFSGNLGYSEGWLTLLKKTTDGGSTFFNVNPPNYYYTFFAADSNNLYCGGSGGRIARSTNGGISWDSLYTGANLYLVSFRFINLSTGYAVGSNTTIVGTTNGGANWILQHQQGTANIYSVFFVDTQTGWAVGDHSTILKTTNGGVPLDIQPISNEIPNSFNLHQNYPNPFNPSTVIRFDIPSDVKRQTFLQRNGGQANVKLNIYDVMGREVTTLINEQLKPGVYEISWDASDFPSGIYFARLSAGSFSKTMKMILLK